MAVTIDASLSGGLGMTADNSGIIQFKSGGSNTVNIDTSGNLTAVSLIPAGSSVPTNGMFLPTTNTVGFSTNSTERMRISSAGLVGIGTTSPTTGLTLNNNSGFSGTPTAITYGVHIVGADANTGGMTIDTFGSNIQFTYRRANGTLASPTALSSGDTIFSITGRGYGATGYSSGNRGLISLVAAENWTDSAQGTYWQFNTVATGATTSTERMRIDSSGNVGIGVTPSAWGGIYKGLDVSTYTGFYGATNNTGTGIVQNAYNNGTNWVYKNTNAASNYILSGGGHFWYYAASGTAGNTFTFTEAMRLDGSGNLFVEVMATTASAANVFVDTTTTPVNQIKRSTSSLRYKTDIRDYDKGLTTVAALRPVYYKGINDGDKEFAGLIAEEVDAEGLSEFVQYNSDGQPDALAYGNMIALLTKAIQELKSEFDAYKASHP